RFVWQAREIRRPATPPAKSRPREKITVKSQLFSASHFALRHRLTEGNRRRRTALLLRVREARGAPCVPRLSLAPLPLDIARFALRRGDRRFRWNGAGR